MIKRCGWANTPLYIRYHDEEWGVPLHDDRHLFELLILEGAQAGLSWITVLNKRENYRKAFENFDPEKVVRFGKNKIEELINDPGIIRNRLKIESAVKNAGSFLKIREQYGSFDRYFWNFTEGKPINNAWAHLEEIPASTPLSDKISKDLKSKNFKFVGTVICYSYMQAAGMVNDHLTECFRYKEIEKIIKSGNYL